MFVSLYSVMKGTNKKFLFFELKYNLMSVVNSWRSNLEVIFLLQLQFIFKLYHQCITDFSLSPVISIVLFLLFNEPPWWRADAL
jgi:hypothetical protein